MRFLVLMAVALAASACAARKIPGTEIDDTSETRAILDVVSKYRRAVESRDAQALIDLADESFRDDGGSADPDDDLDFKSLFTALPGRFQKLDEVKLDVAVRRIELDGDGRVARVTYSYTMSFRMPQLSERTQSETDIKQMALKRVGERDWKIVSGI
ncbi:MAG: DUF4440 domain-containing protein [Deltaproteobacteria bacterium]|nr:DUF4440 domain-containing protein [Deltaproteobacteria bacterium]